MEQIVEARETIPHEVLDQAVCVVIVPSVAKFAGGTAGSYGPGVMTCRSGIGFYGPWGAPAMVTLESSTAGSRLSGNATDFVIFLMSKRALDHLLEGKFKLPGDAPVVATASRDTDIIVRAEILSYLRTRGEFTNTSLDGSTLKPDNDANKNLYGKDISAKGIVFNKAVSVPASANNLLALLQKVSPTRKMPAVPR